MLIITTLIIIFILSASTGLVAQEVSPPLVASSDGLQMSAVLVGGESVLVTFSIPTDGPDRLLLPIGSDAPVPASLSDTFFASASLADYLELGDDSVFISGSYVSVQQNLRELIKDQLLQVQIPFVRIDDGAHVLRFSCLGHKVTQWRLVPADDDVDAETRPYVTRSEVIVPAGLYRGQVTCLIGSQ